MIEKSLFCLLNPKIIPMICKSTFKIILSGISLFYSQVKLRQLRWKVQKIVSAHQGWELTYPWVNQVCNERFVWISRFFYITLELSFASSLQKTPIISWQAFRRRYKERIYRNYSSWELKHTWQHLKLEKKTKKWRIALGLRVPIFRYKSSEIKTF